MNILQSANINQLCMICWKSKFYYSLNSRAVSGFKSWGVKKYFFYPLLSPSVGCYMETSHHGNALKETFEEFPHYFGNNLCKKVPRKKVSGKNLEINTLEKNPNFIKFLKKMSLEIKSCVLDSWDIFS